jgi:phenylacetate-CoA ligase
VVADELPGAPGHALEILDSVVWPEVCKDGSGSHELVLTGLANAAMPLLRYRSGDLAEIECRADEVAGRIVVLGGRVHDVVPIAGRHFPTHYIQDVLDRFGPVQEFQVELRDAAPPLLRLVVDEAARDAVRRAVREHWGDALELEFSGHDGLVRQGERSKFRYVVDRRP